MLVADKIIMTQVQRYFEEVYEKGHPEKLDEFCNPDMVSYGLPAPFTTDLAGLKHMVAVIHSAFSDISWKAEEVIVEGDRVAIRWVSNSIHTGEFMGIPASGMMCSMTGMDFWHMRDGKIAEKWVNCDLMGLMAQIGAFDNQAP